MATVSCEQLVAAPAAGVERHWYDTAGWPAWVDGLDRVLDVRDPWPAPGGVLRWESGPAGRGQVSETVVTYAPGAGQSVEVSDDEIDGVQTVTFTPHGPGVRVTLTLRYRIRRRSPLTPVIDRLFVRRAMTQSLQRTLGRFGARAERAAAAPE